jgi:hypothetical protein
LIPNFDAKAHVVDFLSDLLAKEKFRSPLDRQEFALEITSHARELAMRLRRNRTKESYRTPSKGRRGDATGRNAGAASGLREGVRRLEQEIAKLAAAAEELCSAKSNADGKASGMEVVRLRDALDKIATQVAEAEAAVRIALS